MPKRIAVDIEKVLELKGAIDPGTRGSMWVYAHISPPVDIGRGTAQYALLAPAPEHGIAYLGEINPETREFRTYEAIGISKPTYYERAKNRVIRQMSVPVDQLENLKTKDEVLAIPGISVGRELIPE